SDGSEGAMCGNAIRCITMWLHQHHSPAQTSFRIETQSRIVETSVIESHTAEQKAVVRVNMGPASEARLNTNTSPSNANSAIRSADALVRQTVVSNVMIAEKPVVASCVSMGNPHAVIFVSTLDEINFAENGPAIEHHTLFPDRTNVEFVQVLDRHRAKVRVWERGSGETMACGSGACAVAVAGIAYGAFPDNQPVSIQMRGGVLQIEWPDRKNVFMQGPAEESFRGVVPTAFSGD
ncbi:MAG: diaminopimelate epimerase, partial [Planctomycetaceae bacterium]|nr:diaminopimelate epimerase [Planctomycetaceae bacterium]